MNNYFTRGRFWEGKHAEKRFLMEYVNIAADIDCHDGGDPYAAQELARKFSHKVKEAAYGGLLPMPNTFVHTGRGLQVLWALVPMRASKKGAAGAYSKAVGIICDALRGLLDAPGFAGLELDVGATKNAGGLVRFPGSANAKAPGWRAWFEVVSYDARLDLAGYLPEEAAEENKSDIELPKAGLSAWLDYTCAQAGEAKGKGAWFDSAARHWYAPKGADLAAFEGHVIPGETYELYTAFCAAAAEEDRLCKAKPVKKKRGTWKKMEGTEYIEMGPAAAKQRIRDLDTICAMRTAAGRPFGEGKRDFVLLLYYCAWRRTGMSHEEAFRKTYAVNLRLFGNPLSLGELDAYLRSAREKLYSYGNKAMKELLGLTDEECRAAGISLGGYITNEERDAASKARKEKRDGRIISLHREGMNIVEIAAETGISRQTVSKVLQKSGEREKSTGRTEEALESLLHAASDILQGEKGTLAGLAAKLSGLSLTAIYNYIHSFGGKDAIMAMAMGCAQDASLGSAQDMPCTEVAAVLATPHGSADVSSQGTVSATATESFVLTPLGAFFKHVKFLINMFCCVLAGSLRYTESRKYTVCLLFPNINSHMLLVPAFTGLSPPGHAQGAPYPGIPMGAHWQMHIPSPPSPSAHSMSIAPDRKAA